MGVIVPVIPIKSSQQLLHPILQSLYELLRCVLELLEFGFPRSLPFTISVGKGIVTVALIDHDQDRSLL
jgi:hypothetical protein